MEGIVEAANSLLPSYAADKERLICDRRDEVIHAWRQLQCAAEQRKARLHDASDVHRFFSMVRELRLWMDTIRMEMTTKEKPRLVVNFLSSNVFYSSLIILLYIIQL